MLITSLETLIIQLPKFIIICSLAAFCIFYILLITEFNNKERVKNNCSSWRTHYNVFIL